MTHFLGDVGPAFAREGFVVNSICNNVYRINNSDRLTKRCAEGIISSLQYSPIVSQNRIDGNIEFTVVPYEVGEKFNKAVCKNKEMSSDELWSSVEATRSLFKKGEPIVVRGKRLYDSFLEGESKMAMACSGVATFIIEFFDQDLPKGVALDLGCGKGGNSLPLLKRGWDVVAVDKISEVLEIYRSSANRVNRKFLETGSLRLINADIVSHELSRSRFDIVICVDVLPYIDSKKLKSLMEKIHYALVPNGRFMGTLFFSVPGNEIVEELMGKLGAHFYEGEHVVPSLLKHSGFHANDCAIRLCDQGASVCVEFSATKV